MITCRDTEYVLLEYCRDTDTQHLDAFSFFLKVIFLKKERFFFWILITHLQNTNFVFSRCAMCIRFLLHLTLQLSGTRQQHVRTSLQAETEVVIYDYMQRYRVRVIRILQRHRHQTPCFLLKKKKDSHFANELRSRTSFAFFAHRVSLT